LSRHTHNGVPIDQNSDYGKIGRVDTMKSSISIK